MTDAAPTAKQLKEQAQRHRKLAERHPSKAARHYDIANALEQAADAITVEEEFAAREQNLEHLKILIAEQEAAGRYDDGRRARELLAEATESIGLTRMGWKRRGGRGSEP